MADLRQFISNLLKKYRLTKSLKDNHKGLKDNHVVYSTHASKFQILIKTLRNTIAIIIKSSNSIKAIKEIIQEKEGIPVEEQRLIMGRKELNNFKTAAEYKINTGSIIHIILKLKGGMNNGDKSSLTENILSVQESD